MLVPKLWLWNVIVLEAIASCAVMFQAGAWEQEVLGWWPLTQQRK